MGWTTGLLVCMAWIGVNAGGGTFYVATDGDDLAGDGSQANPWATITGALDRVPAGSLILVEPGLYQGRIRLRGVFSPPVTVRSEVPYRALLRHSGTVITCFDGVGITLEGFDIAHDPGASGLVIQIQDLRGSPGGADATSQIVLRDNIIHNSVNNDLLKINFGARDILVEGNLFFNQEGSDEHMDINGVENVVVRRNILFNDFAGSGRTNNNDTSSFIVIKNSAGLAGSSGHLVEGNIFLNWEGSTGNNFILIGEDGLASFEAEDVLIQNNLFLGNSANVMRAAFGVKGGRNITFRNNTVSGDLPALAYAMRLNTEGLNPANENIRFYNNIWSDPTGTMGAGNGSGSNDFSDTPPGETTSFTLSNNLYWNGGDSVPDNAADLVNPSDDLAAWFGDPQLPDPANPLLPTWLGMSFASGNLRIAEEHARLAVLGIPGPGSIGLDVADAANSPADDLLGNPRGAAPDVGALERAPCQGDTNGDDQVDQADLDQALPLWNGSDALGDLDGDGVVSVADLARIRSLFGPCL